MLKVHFAAVEDINYAMQAKLGEAKYSLMTAYPFIRKGVAKKEDIVRYLKEFSNHIILDSGLFTLMFGAEKGKKSKQFIYEWQERLVQFIKANEMQFTPVEVDCQKVLSPADAWELRIKMREALPGLKVINVFHLEDKKIGLDRLIEFSDYIAISVPELRMNKKVNANKTTIELANYIKNKKPNIDIHLLGCTSLELLQQCKFCTSSDSTSWKQFARWGGSTFKVGDKHMKGRFVINKETYESTMQQVRRELQMLNKKTTPKLEDIICRGIIQVKEHVKLYSKYAGPQN